MSHTREQWAKVKALWEGGMELAEIVKQPGIVISKPQICKKAKSENWEKGNNVSRVSFLGINARKDLAKYEAEKETLTPIEKRAVETIVEARTKHLPALFSAGMFAVKSGVEILKKEKDMRNAVGLSAVVKNVGSVLEPKVPMQVNVTQQSAIVANTLSDDELAAIASGSR